MVIKASVGASRRRLISEVLIETTVLTTAGALFGMVLGSWALSVIKSLSPQDLYRFQEAHLGRDGAPLCTWPHGFGCGAGGIIAGVEPV